MARVLGVCINLLLKFIEIHSQEHVWVMDKRFAMVFEWGMLPCLLSYSIHKFWHEHIGQAQLQIQKGSFENRSRLLLLKIFSVCAIDLVGFENKGVVEIRYSESETT